MALTNEQFERYKKNIVIPAIGSKGQEKLLNSKVLIVGVGGLGSSCAFYLAAAGIGRIGIVDFDSVETENLQRQILYTVNDVGELKVESARRRINEFNPGIEVVPYKIKVSSKNDLDIINDYEVIVECSDNLSTKYLVNDACVSKNKPLVYAAGIMFEGQAMTILPGSSACYRCVFPNAPSEKNLFMETGEIGTLGAVAGVLGVIQSNEVIKYILNIGELLTNKLLIFDSLSLEFRKVEARRSPCCPVCG